MAKKVIRLTESELTRLIQRIVEEEQTSITSSSIPKDYCKVKIYDTVKVDDDSKTVYRGEKKQRISRGMEIKKGEVIGVQHDDSVRVQSIKFGGHYDLYCERYTNKGIMGPLE